MASLGYIVTPSLAALEQIHTRAPGILSLPVNYYIGFTSITSKLKGKKFRVSLRLITVRTRARGIA